MTDECRLELKTAVVDVLNESRDETNLSELLNRLHELRIEDDTAVKAVIWQLVADGEVELTSRRALKVPQRYRRDFALAK